MIYFKENTKIHIIDRITQQNSSNKCRFLELSYRKLDPFLHLNGSVQYGIQHMHLMDNLHVIFNLQIEYVSLMYTFIEYRVTFSNCIYVHFTYTVQISSDWRRLLLFSYIWFISFEFIKKTILEQLGILVFFCYMYVC